MKLLEDQLLDHIKSAMASLDAANLSVHMHSFRDASRQLGDALTDIRVADDLIHSEIFGPDGEDEDE